MPRDPYPFPRYENDTEFAGQKETSQVIRHKPNKATKLHSHVPDDRAWDRLYQTQTLASTRRKVFHHDPQAPNDALDFVIKSKYDHHNEFLRSKAETFFQPETLGIPLGRQLKNKPPPPPPVIEPEDIVLRKSIGTKKENINSINGAIASHHSAATNGGYSRKDDGGFYTC
ncbi:protein CFAP276-like [Rhopilema esculentum]|uniref:protein CFAP276-like n=1 Tax=Rhopilema esculentum TaxID=499914 RepID=UPI0031D25AEA|eukprot:gene2274-17887_t